MRSALVILLALLLLLSESCASSQKPPVPYLKNDTFSSFINRLMENYNEEQDPRDDITGHTRYTLVNISLHFAKFSEISVSKMDYQVNMYLTQRWIDPRLRFTGSGLHDFDIHGKFSKRIWTPDTFFPNEKLAERHTITKVNTVMRIHPNGEVYYNQRLKVTFSCVMHLHWYPVDTQICPVFVEAYGHSSKELRYRWYPDKDTAVTVDSGAMLSSQFELLNVKVEETNSTNLYGEADNKVSSVRIYFQLRRQIGFYLLDSYLPFICIVLVSMTSCWISPAAAPARVTIGVITILSIIVHNAGIQRQVAGVAYMKALDLYMFVCLILAIISWFEFIAAHNLLVIAERHSNNPPVSDKDKEENERGAGCGRRRPFSQWMEWRRLDKITRYALPVAFLIFNILYWMVLGVHRFV